MSGWVVLKFGGSSVARPEHWRNIATIITRRRQAGWRVMVVLSALKNVTNMLEGLLHQARAGVHTQALTNLHRLHLQFATDLGLDGETILGATWQALNECLDRIAQHKTITPCLHASVLAYGELMSTQLGVAYLHQQGLPASWQDVRHWLVSEPKGDAWHDYLSAECEYHSDPVWRASLPEQAIVITQGFIASHPNGDTVLLGREGSDTTAAYLAAKLEAKALEIWTDVPGIFTTDPREDSTARQLKYLSYAQAADMTACGARVLHHRALAPAHKNNIPVWIRATSDPDQAGTKVCADVAHHDAAIAVARQDDVLWLQFEPLSQSEMDRVVHALSSHGFDLLAQFAATDRVDLVLYWANTDAPEPDVTSLIPISPHKVERGLARVTVIGSQQGDWQSSLGDVLSARVPVHAQFHEPTKMSWLVPVGAGIEAQRALHEQVRERLPTSLVGLAWQGWVNSSQAY